MTAKELRDTARAFGMTAPAAFWDNPDEWLEGIANGIGPARWKEERRAALSLVLTDLFDEETARGFYAAAGIHDVGYHLGRSQEHKDKTDDDYRENNQIVAVSGFSLLRAFRRPKREFGQLGGKLLIAHGFAGIVDRYGDAAFWEGKRE